MTLLRRTSIADGGAAHRVAVAPDLALTWPLPARDPARIPPSVTPLPRERRESTTERAWSLDRLAGRIVELSSPPVGASAGLNAAASLLVQAQLRGEPTAWITADGSCFFPPDLAECGVDLATLAVVRAESVAISLRAADRLLRSGAFGLVVLDFGAAPPAPLPPPSQTRLAGLVHRHHATLLCLTRKGADAPSLGSLISLRGEGTLQRTGFDRFTWRLHVMKDKRQGPGWSHTEICRGPDGLC